MTPPQRRSRVYRRPRFGPWLSWRTVLPLLASAGLTLAWAAHRLRAGR